MDFFEMTQQRYSVRKFADRPVEEDKLQKVLEAGRNAPTAKNIQPQRIYVLESEEALAKIRSVTKFAFNAPVVMLICADRQEAWVNPFTERSSAEMDCTIAAAHMMLEAQAQGLGTCWVCWVDMEKAREVFEIPEHIELYAMMPLGYAAEDCLPSSMHASRRSLSETVVRK